MISILAHRGVWRESGAEPNSGEAFALAFEAGVGVELDVRDYNGAIVVAHDPVASEHPDLLRLNDVLELRRRVFSGTTLPAIALNVKSDGIARMISSCYRELGIDSLLDPAMGRDFVFDCSAPELKQYIELGIRAYTRLSDIESQAVLAENAQGIWLDAFYSDWYSTDDLIEMLRARDNVAVVSPELHDRDHSLLWEVLATLSLPSSTSRLEVCTDWPMKASNALGNGGGC